jgi:hypothetical protein
MAKSRTKAQPPSACYALVAVVVIVAVVGVAVVGVVLWAVPGPHGRPAVYVRGVDVAATDPAAPCPDFVGALRSVTFRAVCAQMKVSSLRACLARFLQQLQTVLHQVSEFCGGRAASDAWTVVHCWAIHETMEGVGVNATVVGRHLHTMWSACGTLARACGLRAESTAVSLGQCHSMLDHLAHKVLLPAGWQGGL